MGLSVLLSDEGDGGDGAAYPDNQGGYVILYPNIPDGHVLTGDVTVGWSASLDEAAELRGLMAGDHNIFWESLLSVGVLHFMFVLASQRATDRASYMDASRIYIEGASALRATYAEGSGTPSVAVFL